ncbi:Aste57867_21692 [Aphanomyces stellatus]|uniref:Aste57867_21692 protein n=1 Tax=Aphanomyces stellatus TaxID=120398 RepID=A0A485LI82_9STRA|nr:hypothetical protein As57867_021623 [Aphanomyces stellatus]VFT98361.1 Aste57867_21692 [Aphanomyces stellatus]
MHRLHLFAAITAIVVIQALADDIFALDGHGNPVAWWVVLKFPWEVRNAKGEYIPTPCDCNKPQCTNVGVDAEEKRKYGLCYLYADANNPKLRHFRDAGYDCLGQGGNDPVSQTLRQRQNASHWAIFNDQLNAIAEKVDKRRVCSGESDFNAHAKGAVAFNDDAGGFVLQTSTPNFPDPTLQSSKTSGAATSDDFVRLGCQQDNNVEFAQHLFAMSLDAAALDAVGRGWQASRLCSANHYRDMQARLASPALLHDTKHAIAKALVNPDLDVTASTNMTIEAKACGKSATIRGLFKGKLSEVPPWAMAAETFRSDLSVASWWDENYGIPSLCDGDNFAATPRAFCLKNDPLFLRHDGTFPYNVENLMEATWTMPGGDKASWSLRGGRVRDGNHGKWAIATPRDAHAASTSIFADLNMEGFPCSKNCNGSQGGRGGSFYGIDNDELHESLVSLITDVCKCTPSTGASDPFTEFRMCKHGCTHAIEKFFTHDELPVLSNASTSFWSVHPKLVVVDDAFAAIE